MILRFSTCMVMVLMALFLGCASSSEPPAYYGLQAMVSASGHPDPNQLTIGVGPVQLPDYLDRSPIVTRLNATRLTVHNSHRWVGSLQSEILRVLSANLKKETAARRVVVFPWGSEFEPDVRYRVTIHAFEGRLADQVRLNATWSLSRYAQDGQVITRDSAVVEAVTGDSFEDLVEAMARALAVMSGEMASALQSAAGQQLPGEQKR